MRFLAPHSVLLRRVQRLKVARRLALTGILVSPRPRPVPARIRRRTPTRRNGITRLGRVCVLILRGGPTLPPRLGAPRPLRLEIPKPRILMRHPRLPLRSKRPKPPSATVTEGPAIPLDLRDQEMSPLLLTRTTSPPGPIRTSSPRRLRAQLVKTGERLPRQTPLHSSRTIWTRARARRTHLRVARRPASLMNRVWGVRKVPEYLLGKQYPSLLAPSSSLNIAREARAHRGVPVMMVVPRTLSKSTTE